MNSLLSQRIEKWAKEFQAEGERKGRLEGRQQGRQEGRQQGRLEGEARVLERQLTRRFGDLPAWVRERLGSATEAQLETWTEAVLDAAILSAIFGARSTAPIAPAGAPTKNRPGLVPPVGAAPAAITAAPQATPVGVRPTAQIAPAGAPTQTIPPRSPL
ncbi:DUF4351 domain-containing protein [Thauera sp. GDN1]|uniref:DUF4351 domain-containing protein n=1 Tax=Thauera sp. GDN1 TaxID=2944810 RepID=UPI00247AFE1F|nr:DUF4351 domain-containing protein [Thauera sp. GDN1]